MTRRHLLPAGRLARLLTALTVLTAAGLAGLPAAPAAPTAAALAAPPTPLPRPGGVLERRLAGGEAHRYALPAGGPRELGLTVAQQGIDVVVAVVGPDGRTPLAVDSPNGRWGDEPLLVLPAGAGPWQLEVRSPQAAAAPGSYRLRVAVPADPWQAAALRAATEAGRQFFAGGADGRRQALGRYREALAAWQELGAAAETAGTLFNLAMLHRSLGEPREALALHRQSLPLWQRLGDRRGEARAWMEIGSAAWAIGDSRQASPAYRRALKLWRGLGDDHARDGEARTLNYLGLVLGQDDPRRAIAPYEAALALFRQTGDRRQEGVVLNNLGGVEDQLGEPERALERYRQALRLQTELGDVREQAKVLNNIAAVYRRTGRLQDALEAFDRALAGARQTGDRAGEGSVLNNLGMTHLRLGDTPRAWSELQEALRLRRATQDRRGEATTLHNLGRVRAEQGQWELAAAHYEQALDLRRATGDRGGEAATLYELGRTAGELGRPDDARRALEAALLIVTATGNRWREGLTRAALGQVLADFGAPGPAIGQLTRARELLRAAGDPASESEALLALGRSERAAGRAAGAERAADPLVRAEAHAAAALALLEPLRADLDSPRLRTSFLSRHGDAYELAVDLALELDRRHPGAGWAARGLERSEQARARTLLDLLQQSGAGRRQGVDPALLARQSRLLDRLNAKVAQRRGLLDRPDSAQRGDTRRLAGEVREVQRQLEAVEGEIQRQSPGRGALARPRPLPAAAVQALLDPGTLLLEYALGAERSFLWAVTADRIESFELPPRAAIEALAREVHEGFSTHDPRPRPEEAAAAARLSGLLLGPVAPRLTGQGAGQRLVIVADGALHYLPFAALPRPGGSEPLLVRHEIVALPSASALAVQRQARARRPAAAAARTLAVLADPVFGPPDERLPGPAVAAAADGPAAGFERLPWSGREAALIAAQARPEETLLAVGFDAHRDAALDGRLGPYRLVHFATHGVLDSAHPELSALVLALRAPDGRPREGMLRLPEIANLDLAAELVVLSGCRTALGAQLRGEGLVGLAHGFFAAGARRLVASLWQVQDRASAELMERFYRRLLHGPETMRPAAALRAAQLELRAEPDFRDPYHWAAFAAYGDWR